MFLIIFKADSMMVKFFKPKKSIFNRPRSSIGWREYWEMMLRSDEEAYWMGTYSVSGFLVMRTPQACVEACPNVRLDAVGSRIMICDLCDGDPLCVKWCPEGALTWGGAS